MTTLTSFDKLFLKHKSVSIHQRNLQFQLMEIFKVNNCVSTGVTEGIFQFVDKLYDLRKNSILLRKEKRTAFYETGRLYSLAPKIWELIPESVKHETEISQFKNKIKNQCPCRQ